MKIRVRFFASFREIAHERERTAEVPAGSTPASVLAALAREFPAMEGLRANIVFAVNGDYQAGEAPLAEGDEVAFIPPVSGGQRGRPGRGGWGGSPWGVSIFGCG